MALRSGVGLGVAGVGALAAAGALTRWRWAHAPDPTDGAPLELPPGRETALERPDGTVLAVWEAGRPDDPAVVLVHGWTADRRVWAATARHLLAGGHRVVAYDQRGHGASGSGSDGFTLTALGDDLAAVVGRTDGGRLVVVGHSMGGMAVQHFAIAHPAVVAERVGALVLASTAATGVVNRAAAGALGTGILGAAALSRAFDRPATGRLLVRSSHGRRPSLVALDATRRSVAASSPAARVGFLRAMAGLDTTAGLGGLGVATTVVVGDRDTVTPPRLSDQLVRLIPGARLERIPGAGHQLPFEAPGRLAEVIAAATAVPV